MAHRLKAGPWAPGCHLQTLRSERERLSAEGAELCGQSQHPAKGINRELKSPPGEGEG